MTRQEAIDCAIMEALKASAFASARYDADVQPAKMAAAMTANVWLEIAKALDARPVAADVKPGTPIGNRTGLKY
jgi:hypothetical protein